MEEDYVNPGTKDTDTAAQRRHRHAYHAAPPGRIAHVIGR